jgi:hypothetical protein
VEGEHRSTASYARRVEGEGGPLTFGTPSSANGCSVGASAAAGCGTLPLDGAASRPIRTAWARASRWLVSRGEVSPRTPLSVRTVHLDGNDTF